jgi:hypothetical protein
MFTWFTSHGVDNATREAAFQHSTSMHTDNRWNRGSRNGRIGTRHRYLKIWFEVWRATVRVARAWPQGDRAGVQRTGSYCGRKEVGT